MPTLASQPPNTNVWTYQVRFLVLPTGQVMMSINDGNVYIYTPDASDGTPDPSWVPVITGFPRSEPASGSEKPWHQISSAESSGCR